MTSVYKIYLAVIYKSVIIKIPGDGVSDSCITADKFDELTLSNNLVNYSSLHFEVQQCYASYIGK